MPWVADYSLARPWPLPGYSGVVRYILDGSMVGKGITKAEFDLLLSRGMSVALVMETGTQPALRGTPGGSADARAAFAAADAIGWPANRPIYFVAEDPTRLSTAQWPTVAAYFAGVASVVPPARIGAYGSAALVDWLIGRGQATYGWAVQTWGLLTPRIHLQQMYNPIPGAPSNLGGTVDPNQTLIADWGQHPAPAPTASGGTNLPASTDVVATWVLPGTNGAARCQLHADGGLFAFGGLAPTALRYTAYGNDGSGYDFPDPKYPGVFSYPGFPAVVRDKPFPTRYFTSMHVVSYQGVNYEAAVVVAPFDPGPILARLGTDEANLAQVENNMAHLPPGPAGPPGADAAVVDLGPLGARIDAIVAELATGSDSPAVIAIQVDLAALHAKVVAVAKDLS